MNAFSWPLLRDAGRLLLLQNQPLPTVGKRLRCRGVDSAWRLERSELQRLPDTVGLAQLRPVREAWARLARASFDVETLAALLLVLCTSSSTGARCMGPLPRLCRADIRPWLSDARAIAELLGILSPFVPAAMRMLEVHKGLPMEDLLAMPRLNELDLFVLTRCRERIHASDADAETPLSRELLALAPPGRRWAEAGIAARAIQALNLEDKRDGMGLAMRVWTQSGSAWLRQVAALEGTDHMKMLRMLVLTEAAAKAPPADVWRVFVTLRHMRKRELRGATLRWIIKGLQRGAAPGYLASAMRIAEACHDGNVRDLCEAPQTTVPLSSHLFIWLADATCTHCMTRAWKACSTAPGLHAALAKMQSVKWLDSYAMHDLLNTLRIVFIRKAKQAPIPMEDLKRLADALFAKVRRLGPKKGGDWITTLKGLLSSGTPTTASGFENAMQLSDRLCLVADEAATNIAIVISAMLEARGEEALRMGVLFDSTWCKRIAERGATWVQRDRACEGIRRLPHQAMDKLMPACLFLPVQWFNLMQEIGCVPRCRVKALFDIAAEHPLFACELPLSAPAVALVMIDAVRDERCKTNPVSPRLREHAAGKRTLPKHLLEHDCAQLYRGWQEAQLHLLNELVQREIWGAFPGLKPENGVTVHSLKMVLTMDVNKRPMRRLLRGVAGGDKEWIQRHPLNQRWQEHLGEQCATRWREGIAVVRVLPNMGEVIIAPEDDPQEVLRMGSAVGSCLSLGSFNSFSAAANALDANKRVIYARTRDGKVVGRQLLAISEEKRLVCFAPYPVKLRGPLVEFFADYVEVLAGYLGLPLHRQRGTYRIKTLVSKEWYDDGLWERMRIAA